MQPQKYEFYINDTQVSPHYKQIKKKYTLESDQRFFRVTLDGKITLFGADYYVVKTASIETELVLKVYTTINGARTLYFEGTFSKTDCKFTDDKRMVELGISPRDGYTDIMSNYDHEYNLIDLAPELTDVNMDKWPVLQIYCPESTKVGNFMAGVYWESEVTEAKIDVRGLERDYNFLLGPVGWDIRVKTGAYKATYGGVGDIVTYENTGILFRWTGGIDLVGEGGYSFHGVVMTAYSTSSGKALYQGNLNGTSRWITATLPAVEGSGATGSLSIEATCFYFMSRYLIGSSAAIDPTGTTVSGTRIRSDDFAVSSLNYKWSVPFRLTFGELDISPKRSQEPTKYGRTEDGMYFEQSPGNVHWFPIARSSWDYTSMWFSRSTRIQTMDFYNISRYTMRDGITIGQAIKALLKKIAPGIRHEETPEYSQFLYGSSNPITGDFFRVVITQKSNVLKGIYDEPATKAPVTLETLMNMLRDCFRCYWYIEDGKLKIEHVRYFMNGRSYSSPVTGIDLTTTYDTINLKPFSWGQNDFEYDKSELPARYEFGWMDDSTDVYSGFSIDVNAVYVQKDKTESITVDSFSSDLSLMMLVPNSFSEDGFALMCCTYNDAGGFYNFPFEKVNLIDEKGVTYSIDTANTYATWYYLQRFYMDDMPATNISYEGISNTHFQVRSIKKCMSQTVKFPVKSGDPDPDLYTLVKTDAGNGEISELLINMDTRQAEATLLYEPK